MYFASPWGLLFMSSLRIKGIFFVPWVQSTVLSYQKPENGESHSTRPVVVYVGDWAVHAYEGVPSKQTCSFGRVVVRVRRRGRRVRVLDVGQHELLGRSGRAPHRRGDGDEDDARALHGRTLLD
jgi:hypothetical protein